MVEEGEGLLEEDVLGVVVIPVGLGGLLVVVVFRGGRGSKSEASSSNSTSRS